MLHFKQFLMISVFIFGTSVLASDAPVEVEKESVEFSGHQDEAWMKFQTDLGILKSKLDAQQSLVDELLLNKKNNKGRIGKDQVEQLTQHHKTLQEITKDYNQKLNEFELRYPEKGQALGRQYIRKKSMSLDEMESSLTLDGRIKKMNKKIKQQYTAPSESQVVEKKMPKTDAEKKPQPPKPKSTGDVTEKIILVK